MKQSDRRALVRAYKETLRPVGIFCVRNKVNGKVLVGSSLDLNAGLNRQQAQLRFGAHPNRELSRDWRELGPEAFEFEVLDTLAPPADPAADWDPRPDLAVLEALWLERLQPYGDKGYNERKG